MSSIPGLVYPVSNRPNQQEKIDLPPEESRADDSEGKKSSLPDLLEGVNVDRLSLQQRASLLLNVEHDFHGVLVNNDGDKFEFSSELSFELSHQREFELMLAENQRVIEEAYGLREPAAESDAPAEKTEKELSLDEKVPEFANSENTSERIVGFARAMLPFYLGSADREGDNELTEKNFKGFMELMRNSIKKGFKQAREIIGDLELMNDDLSGLIEKTFGKVEEKLDEFEENTLKSIRNPDEKPEVVDDLPEQPVSGRISSRYETSLNYRRSTTVEFAA